MCVAMLQVTVPPLLPWRHFGSMWDTALLQNWAVELCGMCPVSKGDEDVPASAGLGHSY